MSSSAGGLMFRARGSWHEVRDWLDTPLAMRLSNAGGTSVLATFYVFVPYVALVFMAENDIWFAPADIDALPGAAWATWGVALAAALVVAPLIGFRQQHMNALEASSTIPVASRLLNLAWLMMLPLCLAIASFEFALWWLRLLIL